VLQIIYLLFNEGYSASKGNELIRYELCEEAIRLSELIAAHPALQNKSGVYAILSLMYLNACRFKARTDVKGNILTLAEQTDPFGIAHSCKRDSSIWRSQQVTTPIDLPYSCSDICLPLRRTGFRIH